MNINLNELNIDIYEDQEVIKYLAQKHIPRETRYKPIAGAQCIEIQKRRWLRRMLDILKQIEEGAA